MTTDPDLRYTGAVTVDHMSARFYSSLKVPARPANGKTASPAFTQYPVGDIMILEKIARPMKALLFLSLFLFLLAGPTAVGADGAKPESTTAVRQADADNLIVWYEQDEEKQAWLAPGETALWMDDASSAQDVFSLMPDASVVDRQGPLTVLRSPGVQTRADLDKRLTAMADRAAAGQAWPVFYKSGRRTAASRLISTGEIVVQFPQGTPAAFIDKIEKKYSLLRVQTFDFAPNTFLYRAGGAIESIDTANALYESGQTNYAYPHWRRMRSKRAAPDDPFFVDQWHLDNTGQGGGVAGEDINVLGAWNRALGSSSTVAVVDDGVQLDHEDLVDNIDTSLAWDFSRMDNDPSPFYDDDNHGTSVAGVVAGRGNNALGVTGSAPQAKIAPHRIDLLVADDAQEAAALSRNNDIIDVYSNSWGPSDGSGILAGPGPLTRDALKSGVTYGRSGKGNIYVWAAGNGRQGF